MAETEAAMNEARSRRRGRILRIALVVSLALNLLALGVLAGGVMKGAQVIRSHQTSDLRALWLALPEDARRSMRPSQSERPAESARPETRREERRARAAARQAELLALLRAGEFDEQAFATILMSDHEERSERIARAHQALVAGISALGAADRATMADRLENERSTARPSRPSRR